MHWIFACGRAVTQSAGIESGFGSCLLPKQLWPRRPEIDFARARPTTLPVWKLLVLRVSC
jgi:hypothetical protein